VARSGLPSNRARCWGVKRVLKTQAREAAWHDVEAVRPHSRLVDMQCRQVRPALFLGGAFAVVAATATVAVAVPASVPGCAQFADLKRAFPKATAVGFTSRGRISRGSIRAPIWPGTCAKWFTRYRRGSAGVDVSLTLYKSHRQALVALAEPLFGPVTVLANGAQVRTRRGEGSVNGVRKQYAGVASVYRNVFISSVSIDEAPVPLAAQKRLHRGIHVGVLTVR
jgi:hypothetical protein